MKTEYEKTIEKRHPTIGEGYHLDIGDFVGKEYFEDYMVRKHYETNKKRKSNKFCL